MSFPGLRGLGAWELLKRSVLDFFEDDMATFAAALSFHLFFALFPFLLFLLAVSSLLGITGVFGWTIEQAVQAAPREVGSLVRRVVAQIQGSGLHGFLSLSILLSIWTASSGMRSTMVALNQAFDVKEERPAWKRYLLSILYTLAFTALVLLSTLLVVLGPQFVGLLPGSDPGGTIARVARWVQIPLAIAFAVVAAALIYRYAPCGEQRFRLLTPGSIVAVALWLLTSLAFRYYVGRFANYAVIYGGLGAVIILQLYIFLSAVALLYGGEVNGVLERRVPGGREPRRGSGFGIGGERVRRRPRGGEA